MPLSQAQYTYIPIEAADYDPSTQPAPQPDPGPLWIPMATTRSTICGTTRNDGKFSHGCCILSLEQRQDLMWLESVYCHSGVIIVF